ncbi:hypothetical protein IJ114_01180 [Candidatus Saccharibacteria bacterium]|nr:hypothetical protein [Candidatus Saccharibacteria bacterium]
MKKLYLVLIISILAILGLSSNNTNAASRTAWGARDVSYYSDGEEKLGYHRTLSGASWYYYTIPSNITYTDDDKLYVPFGNNYATKTAIPAKTCQGYGGFWVLLRNEYKMTSETTGELTGRPASAITLSDVISDGASDTWPATNAIKYIIPNLPPDDKNSAGVAAKNYDTLENVKAIYESLKNTTAIPTNADWSTGKISYFCAGDSRPAPAEFSSFSTVSLNDSYTSAPVVNGNSYLANPIIVPTGSTVSITFRHYLAKSIENQLAAANIDYSVSGDGINGSSTGVVPTTNLTERIHIGGSNYYANGTITFKLENVQINSKATYCETVVFNAGSRLRYSLTDYQMTGGGTPVSSKACVTIIPVASTGETVDSCTAWNDPSTFVSNSTIGNTAAVVGLSLNGKLAQVTTSTAYNDKIKVFTRPGDVIQFSYGMCFGAHNVTGRDGKYVTKKIGENNPVVNEFKVVIGSTADGDDNTEFLFGRNDDILGQTVYINNVDARNNKFSGKSLFINYSPSHRVKETGFATFSAGKKELLFASPDNKPKEETETSNEDGGIWYDCAFYANYNLNTNIAITTGGYQIPGFQNHEDKDCNSATLQKTDEEGNPGTYMSNMVGTTLSQSLVYNAVTSMPRYLSNGSQTRGPFFDAVTQGGNWSFAENADYTSALEAYRSGYTIPSGVSSTTAPQVIKSASVVTPYNFDTNISSKIVNHDSGTVYPGDTIELEADVDILPRVNPLVESSGGTPYATTTPSNTRVDVIELLLPEDISLEDRYTYGDEASSDASLLEILNGKGLTFHGTSICTYFRGYLASDYRQCTTETVKGRGASKVYQNDDNAAKIGNQDSNPEGEMDYYHNTIKRVVPDIEAGYKYCIMVGINHGDSHGVPGEELSKYPYIDQNNKLTTAEYRDETDAAGNRIRNADNPNYAANGYSVNGDIRNIVTNSWRLSQASCRTVAKAPNFQTWNGGVYGGDIATSIVKRTVNTKLTTNRTQDSPNVKHIATNPSYFGSWAEYYILAKGEVTGLASASALGYSWNMGALTSDGFSSATIEKDLLAPTQGFCDFSRLTIANANSISGASCLTGGAVGSYTTKTTEDALIDNYKRKITEYYANDTSSINKTEYSQIEGSSDWSQISGADYVKIGNNFTIDKPIIQSSGTRVLQILGHLDIKANICLDDGSGICSEEAAYTGLWSENYQQNSNNLSLTSRNSISYNADDITNIPQIIIIAESISISSEVSQIDAWLITDSPSSFYDGGYINTCQEFKDGTTGSNTCYKTLKINGPVITAALMLNRTGGAWPGFAGDVGNPAYDSLRQKLEEAISDPARRAAAEPEARQYCQARVSSVNCVENRITFLVKQSFLQETESMYGQSARKAYEYAENYSANSKTVSAEASSSRDLSCDGSITPAEIFDLHPLVNLWAYGQSQKNIPVTSSSQELSPRY